MKSLKTLSLLLIATSLASGAVYAKGGGGGMGGGMGNGMHAMSNAGAAHAQQSQHRTQTREQTREGAQGDQALRYENREQLRDSNGLPSL